jgi:serine/threonine-protein kinase
MTDIVGKTVDQAEEQLKDFKGFVVKVEAQDVEAEDGVVISQEPSAGSIIQDKDTVVIYYSSGGSIVEMPDLIGYSYDEAIEILNQYGISNIRTEKVYSNESVEGEIVDQNPGVDEQLNTSDQVTLTVSSISDKYIEFVPNVTGMNVKEAVKACFVRGFSAIYIYEAGYGGDGIVYSQDPEASVQDYSGPVTLKISNRNYNKYVSVIPISYLPDCKSIRITADEIIDGITVEMVLYEESFNDPGRFIADNNGTFKVYLYEPYESSDFIASMTIYTDGKIYMKKSATFLQSK